MQQVLERIKEFFSKVFSPSNKAKAEKAAKGAGRLVKTAVKNVIPQKTDQPDRWYFKLLTLSLVGVIVLAGTVGLAGFLLTLKEPEDVVVPSLVGKDLAESIDSIQQMGLIPSVQQRFYPDPDSRGKIMEQDPKEGAGVKAGRKVTIYLSKGAVLDKVGEYVTRNLEQVRDEIRRLYSNQTALLQLETDDVTYVFDDTPAGTILSQDPTPGTQIANPIRLRLLVSKGKDLVQRKTPQLTGLTFQKAMDELSSRAVPFLWTLIDASSDAKTGLVISQDPSADSGLKATDRVVLALSRPSKIPSGNVFGVYQKSLPSYAVPVDITVQVSDPQGGTQNLYTFKYLGGDLTFPYTVPAGSELIVTAFGKELDRKSLPKSTEGGQ